MVGGMRHLGCWKRHPPRYAKHVKVVISIDFVDFPWFWICRQKYSKFLFLFFQCASTSNEQKQTKRLIHATLFNTVYLTYVFYNNLTHVVVVVPLIHVTNTRSEGSCNTNNSRSFFFTKHKIRDSAISTLYEYVIVVYTSIQNTFLYNIHIYNRIPGFVLRNNHSRCLLIFSLRCTLKHKIRILSIFAGKSKTMENQQNQSKSTQINTFTCM